MEGGDFEIIEKAIRNFWGPFFNNTWIYYVSFETIEASGALVSGHTKYELIPSKSDQVIIKYCYGGKTFSRGGYYASYCNVVAFSNEPFKLHYKHVGFTGDRDDYKEYTENAEPILFETLLEKYFKCKEPGLLLLTLKIKILIEDWVKAINRLYSSLKILNKNQNILYEILDDIIGRINYNIEYGKKEDDWIRIILFKKYELTITSRRVLIYPIQ